MAIYWFHGPAGVGKTTLATKLHNFLKTEKRNWRKDVFLIDDTDITNIQEAHLLVNYLYQNGCDVVVSLTSRILCVREEFKSKFPQGDYQEIYVSREDADLTHYEVPTENVLKIDTTKDTPNISFSKILHELEKLKKL